MATLRIKEICKQQGITLEVLAKRLGIERTSLSQSLSRNSFSTTKLDKIADVLGVEIWELFISGDDLTTPTGQNRLTCPRCGCKLDIDIKEKE